MGEVKARPTRYQGLGYWRQDAGLWRLVDCTEPARPAIIGAPYRTRAELLADLERQATERGFAGAAERGWVVVAWLAERPEVRGTRAGRWGPEPVVVAVPSPSAAVWCRDGGPAELEAARGWCARDRPEGRVYRYGAAEQDPLGRARADVMRDGGHVPPGDRLGLDGRPRTGPLW